MKFEQPKESFVWPPKAMLSHVYLGSKCIVRLIPTEDGLWWEMGGRLIEEPGANMSDSEDSDTIDGDEDETLLPYVHLWSQSEGFGIDKKQSRIYYRFNTKKHEHECRILLPSDFYFRSSRKGMVKKHSKSFMNDGMPRPEVLLLYALKTQELTDRRIAVEAVSEEMWDAQNLAELFRAMDEASMSHHNFCAFAGEWLAAAAAGPGGLADWVIWEKVADAAVAAKKNNALKVENLSNTHTHVQFLRLLKEALEEHRGMPAQVHVRNKFNWKLADSVKNVDDRLANRWKDLLKIMGMTWLPGEQAWNKFHKQLKVDGRNHTEQTPEKIDRRKAKSPKPRR